MAIIEITTLEHPGLEVYGTLTEAQLRNRLHAAEGVFIAESPKVIRVALAAGYTPLSLLCESKHITGDAADIIASCGDIPVYTGERQLLASLTGYTLTRGVLCAMRRAAPPSVAGICEGAHRLAIIDGVVDTTNIGAIFRSAVALGVDGLLLTPTSCDPYNRRAVRVSMGTVLMAPWTWIEGDLRQLHEYGFKTVAMALTDKSVSINDATLCGQSRLAIIMGTEGDGLAQETIDSADYVARIPMSCNVDSLNVAAAAAVAFWQLRYRGDGTI